MTTKTASAAVVEATARVLCDSPHGCPEPGHNYGAARAALRALVDSEAFQDLIVSVLFENTDPGGRLRGNGLAMAAIICTALRPDEDTPT